MNKPTAWNCLDKEQSHEYPVPPLRLESGRSFWEHHGKTENAGYQNFLLYSKSFPEFPLSEEFYCSLTLSQTNPWLYISAGETFWKHCGKRRNCSRRAISPFPTAFFICFKTYCYFHQIWNYHLQTLSVWKCLKSESDLERADWLFPPFFSRNPPHFLEWWGNFLHKQRTKYLVHLLSLCICHEIPPYFLILNQTLLKFVMWWEGVKDLGCSIKDKRFAQEKSAKLWE